VVRPLVTDEAFVCSVLLRCIAMRRARWNKLGVDRSEVMDQAGRSSFFTEGVTALDDTPLPPAAACPACGGILGLRLPVFAWIFGLRVVSFTGPFFGGNGIRRGSFLGPGTGNRRRIAGFGRWGIGSVDLDWCTGNRRGSINFPGPGTGNRRRSAGFGRWRIGSVDLDRLVFQYFRIMIIRRGIT
jgi:hypothetical protein